jgi:hypothetical protein
MSVVDKTKATMNLGWITDYEGISDDERGVILHEFGHCLGLLHEWVEFSYIFFKIIGS